MHVKSEVFAKVISFDIVSHQRKVHTLKPHKNETMFESKPTIWREIQIVCHSSVDKRVVCFSEVPPPVGWNVTCFLIVITWEASQEAGKGKTRGRHLARGKSLHFI